LGPFPNPVHIVDGNVKIGKVNLSSEDVKRAFELFEDNSNVTYSMAAFSEQVGTHRDSLECKIRNDFTLSMYMKLDEFALMSLIEWGSDLYAGVAREQLMLYQNGAASREHIDDQSETPQHVGTTKYLMHLLNQVACLLYISTDDIEGGEFVFTKQNIIVPPTTGTLVCFPSNYQFPHEVLPVIAGKRIAFARHYYVKDLPHV